MIIFYHQTKTPISFLVYAEIESKFFIQSLETLLIEINGTHETFDYFNTNV